MDCFGFITLGIYTRWKKAAHNTVAEPPFHQATLSALLINILGFLPVVLHAISLSEGEIIPFSGVCQSGEAGLSTPEAVVASRTD